MTEVHPGRFTARIDGDSVAVFLIGMRINRPARIGAWWPTVTAMPRMLRHLSQDPEAGLLGFHNWFGRTTLLLSYWRSVEDINRFASDPDAPHAAAWRAFNRRISGSGHVGVWHETYLVRAGDYETVYNGMPRFGLAAATSHVPVVAGLSTARQRRAAGTRSTTSA